LSSWLLCKFLGMSIGCWLARRWFAMIPQLAGDEGLFRLLPLYDCSMRKVISYFQEVLCSCWSDHWDWKSLFWFRHPAARAVVSFSNQFAARVAPSDSALLWLENNCDFWNSFCVPCLPQNWNYTCSSICAHHSPRPMSQTNMITWLISPGSSLVGISHHIQRPHGIPTLQWYKEQVHK